MDKKEFLTELFKLLNYPVSTALLERNLIISVNKAAYEQPSMVVLELEGSPPKFSIILDLSQNPADYSGKHDEEFLRNTMLIVQYKPFDSRKKNKTKAIVLIYEYLKNNNYI